jgi:peptidoglycan endopeptidase LytF
MSRGTKIALAVIALFVGVNIVYFGFIMSGEDPDLPVANDPVAGADGPDEPAAVDGSTRLQSDERSPANPPADAPNGRSTSTPVGTGTGENVADALRELARPLARPEETIQRVGSSASRGDGADPLSDPLQRSPADRSGEDISHVTAGRPGGDPARSTESSDAAPVRDPLVGQGPRAMKPARIDAPEQRGRSQSTVRSIVHTVREGDTLSAIAERRFGNAQLWNVIAEANPGIDPHRLRLGQKLRIPIRAGRRPAGERADDSPRSGLGSGRYTVRSGDTLSSIAGAAYGNETLWRIVYDANRRVIGPDPNALDVGMTLRIPPRSGSDDD